VDLEWIEPRSFEFIRDYFTPGEVKQALAGSVSQNAINATILWSAKEAVLKALTTGLRIDTQKIEIGFGPVSVISGGWNVLTAFSEKVELPSPRLFWRKEGNFIQTICFLDGCNAEMKWVMG
jgi:phosphopantetheinyl transferase